jgi:hypothetical protein
MCAIAGTVSLGVLHKDRAVIEVAIKTNTDSSQDVEDKFILECKQLCAMKHTHIVSLLAVCMQATHKMMVCVCVEGRKEGMIVFIGCAVQLFLNQHT